LIISIFKGDLVRHYLILILSAYLSVSQAVQSADYTTTAPDSLCQPLREDPYLYDACQKVDTKSYQGVSVLDQTGDCSFHSSANSGWLTLVDGRDKVIVTSGLDIKAHQHLLGLDGENPGKVTLRQKSKLSLITSRQEPFHLSNLNLDFRFPGSPLISMGYSQKTIIENNNLKPLEYLNKPTDQTHVYGRDLIHIHGKCVVDENIPDQLQIRDNNFGISGNTGIRTDCQVPEDDLHDRIHVRSFANAYEMGISGVGIAVEQGNMDISHDVFIQYPYESDSFPVGVDYIAPAGGYVEITCSAFVGTIEQNLPVSASSKNLIAIRAKGTGEQVLSGKKEMRIAFNYFGGVETGIELSHGLKVKEGSICNAWVPNGSIGSERCTGSPDEGFIHFMDGTVCGDVPDDFEAPDCLHLFKERCAGAFAESAVRLNYKDNAISESTKIAHSGKSMISTEDAGSKANLEGESKITFITAIAASVFLLPVAVVAWFAICVKTSETKRKIP
jgi:hypothetical protein